METALVRRSSTLPARAALGRAAAAELPAYVSADEVARAVQLERRPEVALLLRFLWLTGARISEALQATPRRVNFRAGTVELPTLKRRKPTARAIPLPGGFLGELATAAAERGLGLDGRFFPWSYARAWELVRDALMAAGVERERAHPHVLRHGHAVHALRGQAPIPAIQRVLGHASITTTARYLQLTAEDVRREYASIDWG